MCKCNCVTLFTLFPVSSGHTEARHCWVQIRYWLPHLQLDIWTSHALHPPDVLFPIIALYSYSTSCLMPGDWEVMVKIKILSVYPSQLCMAGAPGNWPICRAALQCAETSAHSLSVEKAADWLGGNPQSAEPLTLLCYSEPTAQKTSF